MDITEITQQLKWISEKLETGKELISEDAIVKFQDTSKDLKEELEGIMQEGRELRLGIVGEVKAGKSSFLNALLFDGKDVLPKAPTPMTAALTKISYSDKPSAKIVFYNENDWDSIVKFAEKYNETLEDLYNKYLETEALKEKDAKKNKIGLNILPSRKIISREDFEKMSRSQIPNDYIACKEVYNMAEKLNVRQYLGKETTVDPKDLNEYVGADGKFTPIVKYTEISLCNEMLKGIEVVDTPGMNDPILSRSRTTQRFLIQCDAVFLLDYCGQFLGAEEMEFITSSLPNEGISRAVLIGSKMDSAILQYPLKGNPSFKIAYLGTKKNCEEQALANINECSVSAHNEKLLSQLKQSLPPYCVSSLAYAAAQQMQKGKPLGKYEETMVANLCKRFPDFPNNAETLFGLSNIKDVREEVFEKTRTQKAQIIQERMNDVVNSQIVKFKNILEEINIQAKNNQNDLRMYDCEQLKNQLLTFKERLDSVRIVVKGMFEEAAIEAKKVMNEIAVTIGKKMKENSDIDLKKDSKTEQHSSTSGILFWKKEHHWNETITTYRVEVNDAYKNIREYLSNCEETINHEYKNLLNLNELQNKIIDVVKAAFDQADKNFDENKIWVPLKNALKELILPDFQIISDPYEEALDKELGGIVSNGVVLNEKVPLVKKAQDKILNKMSEDVRIKIKEDGENLSRKLYNEAAEFIDNIVEQLESNQNKLEKMIKDKEENLKKFDLFIADISNAKDILRKLEG